ncbi:MAG: xanthine dehydrogenase molybdopterin binding subunit [Verrucomicrobiota bacterium]
MSSLTINGAAHDISAAPLHQTLLDYLRKTGLPGTKCGCNEGDCGACTLLLLQPDGQAPRAVNSCLTLVHAMAGQEVLTSEGLASDDQLHPAQTEMVEKLGSQCGYCTPGIICSMAEASARGLTQDPAAVADQLCGNLCRCTGYRPIREAALATPPTPLPSKKPTTPPASTPHFFRPTTVPEALQLKQDHPEAEYLAGATETAVLMNKHGHRPPAFISLEHVPSLKTIELKPTKPSPQAAQKNSNPTKPPFSPLAPVQNRNPKTQSNQLRAFASSRETQTPNPNQENLCASASPRDAQSKTSGTKNSKTKNPIHPIHPSPTPNNPAKDYLLPSSPPVQTDPSPEYWHLGAAAPLTDIEEALANEIPAITQMLRLFASRQIRHRATLGGNLVTASPIGDSAPVLLALDASVVLESLRGQRTLPLTDFFLDFRKTALADDELLVAIEIPRHLPGQKETTFNKVSKRREMDISTVSAAIRIATDDSGTITDARLAFGGVAATPARALKTEQALLGKNINAAVTPEILSLLQSEFAPIDDQRGSAAYRSLLIRDLFIQHLAGEVPTLPAFQTAPAWPDSTKARPHESAVGHVTGTARYVEDDSLLHSSPLQVWPVLAPVAHATITRFDTSPAENEPGVTTILTAADIPGLNNTGPARHDEPLFAENEILYHGQLLAAVIGPDLEACRLAATKIILEYETRPPLLGIPAAIAADSFHTDPHHLTRGDLKEGFAQSTHTLSGTLEIGGQEHFYLETQAASARLDGDGGLFVRSSTQHPSEIQAIVAEILGKAKHDITVESPRMGGGFGGKETQGNAWSALCALAALKTGRETVVQLDRDHDITWSGKRHPFHATYKVGFDDQGKILAAQVDLVSDGGWSLDLSLPVCDRALFHLDNAYYLPHVHFTGRVAKTNVTSHTAFRGFGGPQGMLVIEEIVGQVASRLQLPPEQVREHNFYHGTGETSTTHYGELIEGNRLPLLWQPLLESSDFHSRRSEIDHWNAAHPNRKRGLAITPVKFGISFTLKHYNQAGALVLIYADGSVQVNHGGTEMGQGLHTKILGVAMRELGLPAESIRLMQTRTDKVPNTSATAASSGSDLNGMAVADACQQIKARLLPLAAQLLNCAETDITFADGQVVAPNASLPFPELIQAAYQNRIQLSAAGFYKTPDLEWDWNVGKGKPFHYFAFGAAVSEVEIDGYTGMHHVRRVDILHDVGDSLNPAVDRGQIEGAFVQGMGWLTAEELKWADDGRLLTHSASTYAIPAFSDAPAEFNVHLVEDAPQDRTIHRSKAVGEPPFMLALSIREALRHALTAFNQHPTSENFPSPLTAETIKTLLGPTYPLHHQDSGQGLKT